VFTRQPRPQWVNEADGAYSMRDEAKGSGAGRMWPGTVRTALFTSVALLAIAGAARHDAAHAQGTAAQVLMLDIRSQSLGAALTAFADRASLRLLFPSSLVAGRTSPALAGRFTREQALSRLLEGTGLAYAFTDAGTVTITDPAGAAPGAPDAEGSILLGTIDVVADGGPGAASGAGFQGTPDWVYETPASVGVVSGEAIRSSGARNVRDAIASAPGVYSGEGQGSFPTVSPNIRGVGDSGRVVVSIDGARQNAQDGGRYGGGTGGYGTAFVDSAFVRRVDIDKNPGAKAGSAGSLGGGVNFRTINADDIIKPGAQWGVELGSTTGNNGHDFQGSVIAATRIGDHVALTAGFSRTELEDYEPGQHGSVSSSSVYNMTGRESWSSLLKVEGEFDDVRTSLSWMHQDNAWGYSPSGSTVGSTFDATNDSVSASVDWDPESPLIKARATAWFNDFSSVELREARILDGSVIWPETVQQRDLVSFGGTVENTSELHTALGEHSVNYGVEAFRDDGTSSAMNDDIAEDPRYASGYLQFNRPGTRDVVSAFVSETWKPAEWFSVSGGLRYDWYHLSGSSTYYRYQAAVDYKANCVMSEYDYRIAYMPSWDPSTASNSLIRVLKNRCGEVHDGTFYTSGTTISALSTPVTYPETTLDIDRTDGALLPSATAEFAPFDWLRPYVSYSHSFRPPTITEAFFSGGVSPIVGIDTDGAPNVDLRGEAARTWEAGLNVIGDDVFRPGDSFRLKAAVFERTIEDYIVLGYIRVPDVDEDLLSFVNAAGDTTMQGIELEANYDAGTHWIGAAATWLETTWPTSTQIFTNDGGSTTGEIFAFAGAVPPRFKVTVDAGVRLFDRRVVLGARVNHVTPNLAHYLDENGNIAETGDPYTTLDLHGSFDLGEQATLNLSFNNVTDQRYIPATGNYIAPGRTFLMGLNVKF